MKIRDFIKDNKKMIIQGFVLSVLLLTFADILYRFTFNHAKSLDPFLYDVKIDFIDNKIPVVPLCFFGYNLAFIFWFFAPFFIVQTGKRKTINFIIIFVLSLIVCNLILYFFPTKIDRVNEGLFDPNNDSFLWKLLHICYKVDGGKVGYNLLPSTHVNNSIVYYHAMKDINIKKKYQNMALISTIIVIISTLLVKQHYFFDVVVGAIIPYIIESIMYKTNILKRED